MPRPQAGLGRLDNAPPDRDRVRLLHGPYEAPPLRVGDRTTCVFRDCDVVVTSWTDARVSWPRCRPLDVRRSRPGLLVNEDLARAVRCEAAAALTYWWGASEFVIRKWRRALGVSRTDNEGTRRLIQAAAEAGARAARDRPVPPEERERRRRAALEKDLGRYLLPGFNGFNVRAWTRKEDKLVRTMPPAEVASRTGRTLTAVYDRRSLLGVPDGRRRG
jgi:hypothetical protein